MELLTHGSVSSPRFIKDGVNKRTDEYGGCIENRCRCARSPRLFFSSVQTRIGKVLQPTCAGVSHHLAACQLVMAVSGWSPCTVRACMYSFALEVVKASNPSS